VLRARHKRIHVRVYGYVGKGTHKQKERKEAGKNSGIGKGYAVACILVRGDCEDYHVCVTRGVQYHSCIIAHHSSFVNKAKSSGPISPKVRLVSLEALGPTQHSHIRPQTQELLSKINNKFE
jgi:hypothetical protein